MLEIVNVTCGIWDKHFRNELQESWHLLGGQPMIYTAIMIYLIIALLHLLCIAANRKAMSTFNKYAHQPFMVAFFFILAALIWPRWHYEVILDWRKND